MANAWTLDLNIAIDKCTALNMTSTPTPTDNRTTSPTHNHCADSVQTSIFSEYYGTYKTGSDDRKTKINEGRINAIESWGIENSASHSSNAISRMRWKSDKETDFDDITCGCISSVIPCDPFTLDDDDYINGYRVYYAKYINGLVFYTLR